MSSDNIDQFIDSFKNNELVSEVKKLFSSNEIFNLLEIDEPGECSKIFSPVQIPKPMGVYFLNHLQQFKHQILLFLIYLDLVFYYRLLYFKQMCVILVLLKIHYFVH